MERRVRPAQPPAELVIGNGDAAHADPFAPEPLEEGSDAERLLGKRRSGSLLREAAAPAQPPAGQPYCITSPAEDLETERLLAKRRSASLLRDCEAQYAQPYAVTSPAEDAEAAAAVAARLLAKRRSASSLHSRDAVLFPEPGLPQPYCVASPAEEAEAAARALAKRRSIASSRDGSIGGGPRDTLHVLHDAYHRKLSFPDLVGAGADPCVLRNQHFDEPPPPPSQSGSRRGSAAELAAAAVRQHSGSVGSGSRRGSSCFAYHDDAAAAVAPRGRHVLAEGGAARGAVFANRHRRISCLVEGAASPAVYKCNGYRCGDSHHCPEAYDDPCCGAGETEDFWVQSYYNARRKNKKAKARAKARGAGGRRASRVPGAGKRLSVAPGGLAGAGGDFEAGKEVVTAADKKRRWVVYIFATFVVMLVALAILMVIVSLSMNSPGKEKGNATTTAATPLAPNMASSSGPVPNLEWSAGNASRWVLRQKTMGSKKRSRVALMDAGSSNRRAAPLAANRCTPASPSLVLLNDSVLLRLASPRLCALLGFSIFPQLRLHEPF